MSQPIDIAQERDEFAWRETDPDVAYYARIFIPYAFAELEAARAEIAELQSELERWKSKTSSVSVSTEDGWSSAVPAVREAMRH